MDVVYAGMGIAVILFIKPLIWVPMLFVLDRLAGLIGPRFRAKVSGHYAGKPIGYFFIAQYSGPKAAQQALEQRARGQTPAAQ